MRPGKPELEHAMTCRCFTICRLGSLLLLTLYGCIDKLPVKDAPCPCAEGWVCCAGTQSCALQDSECPVLCGNGLVEEGEDCDDGNTRDDGNGCSDTCSQNNICGDGVLQSLFESCDDGEFNASYAPDATCGPTCEGLSGFCGDGIVNGPEPCDDGNAIDEDACLAGCVLNVCGDGLLNPNTEACDDGNSFTWDGCRNTGAAAGGGFSMKVHVQDDSPGILHVSL